MDNNQTFLNACRNGQKSIVQIFLKKGFHKFICIIAAVECSITKFCLQQIPGQTIIAEQRMVSVCLIMEVEAFPFLIAVGAK